MFTILAASSAGAFLDFHGKMFILLLTAGMLRKCQARNKEEMQERHLSECTLGNTLMLVLLTLLLSRRTLGYKSAFLLKHKKGSCLLMQYLKL